MLNNVNDCSSHSNTDTCTLICRGQWAATCGQLYINIYLLVSNGQISCLLAVESESERVNALVLL